MTPSDAKRMSSGVGVRLVALLGIEVGSRPEKSGSESHRLLVRNPRISDVEIEVNLLRATVRPVRGDVVRSELHPDPPLTSGINDAMPTLILEDAPSKDPGPECALRMYVRCVEHDDLTHHLHDPDHRDRTFNWSADPGSVLDDAILCPRAASGDAVHPVLHTAAFFETTL